MRDSREKFARRLDRLVSRYQGRVDHKDLELLLQQAAQDQREQRGPPIPAEDIEGWSE